MILRDFYYLDTARLSDYISNLDPGDTKEIRETITQESDQGPGVVELDADPGIVQMPQKKMRERVLQISEKHSFNLLYGKMQESLVEIDDDVDVSSLKRSAVEVTREFELSPINNMIDSLFQLIKMMQSMDAPELKDAESRQIITMMSVLFQNPDEKKDETSLVSMGNDGELSVVFSAQQQYMLRNLKDLEGEATLVGKATKVIKEGDSLDLLSHLRILPRSIRRNQGMRESLMKMFEDWPKELGLGPSVGHDSLVIEGPVVVVDPLAVFID
ncbi:hypothetical protein [Nocardiopsis sp. YSL2]|uniref:DUF6414 family protein n=1 Tax=Nocardiopsis sp. YSL2 TaxID=2939492 RepID=UPI0026F44CC3|nr:hypothetical protein [Nocardiopsis sp. YSL2]